MKNHLSSGVYDMDLTKLVIDVTGLGIYGYDAYKEIRINDNVQLELGEVSVVLACLSPGTTKEHIDNLIHAFEKLSKKHRKSEETDIPSYHYSYPRMIVPPRDAYDAPHKIVPLTNCIGEISAETVMAYPPGIPLVIPGKIITDEAVKLIECYSKEGGEVLKDTPEDVIKIIDRSNWYLSDSIPLSDL